MKTRCWTVVLAAMLGVGIPIKSQSQSQSQSQFESQSQSESQSRAAVSGLDAARMAKIAEVVGQAIEARELPGAVVMAGRGDEVLYQQAFGSRAVEPSPEAMTLDTIFDLASLTKVVATTPAIMMLVEDGKVRLNDRVAKYIEGFERYGKGDITVRHLLTHVSGLRPDLDMSLEFESYDEAIERAKQEVPTSAPGERFVYSDINFFLLGEIVHRVSGLPLDRFVRERLFGPLGMHETMFTPPEALAPRIAPTEKCSPLGWPCETPDANMLRGVVHDPTARRMQGVAGHAGLFSTAADLSIFCRMLLNHGRFRQVRVLSPMAVEKMTGPVPVPGGVRGLGWDIDTGYSSNRGELLPIGSFGHTGFTGTSIWVDPLTGTWLVFLSNRVHPDGKGDVTPLRARVATILGSAISEVPAHEQPLRLTGIDAGPAGRLERPVGAPVLNGVDVLKAEGFRALAGRRVGLVTNHTGISADGESTIDLLTAAKNLALVALFSPEHGIRGTLDQEVIKSSKDPKTGLPIYSLHGDTTRPTEQMLAGIDTLVYDIQDVGVRFYTYETTLGYVLEEAAKRKIKVVVLDRVNPINGWEVEGPALARTATSFVGYFPGAPIRHGMTVGELALLFNAENGIGADLAVVPIAGWRRDSWFDDTGMPWVNPSPNMRNLNQATLYPGIGAIEYSNLSVGRGTDTPFEQVGAPWIDGRRLAARLNARQVPGIRFYPTSFTPGDSKYKGERCGGVFMVVTDREALRPVRVGVEVASAIYGLYGDKLKLDPNV
ncbi:MAG: pbpE 6, partial [Acidobacteria bacterium]|nr:pbpE 6 [Acidobacteriota bacterium]